MATRPELLEATDEIIDDAVRYADPMVLRGLLHQLTGDEAVAAANNYYQNDFGRSAVNCPIDGRKMWNWLRSPTVRREDIAEHAGVKPYFGDDLIVK